MPVSRLISVVCGLTVCGLLFVVCGSVVSVWSTSSTLVSAEETRPVAIRTTRGLQHLYVFSGETDSRKSKTLVRDVAGTESPLDLQITKPQSVRWTDQALSLQSSTALRSQQPATQLVQAVKKSGEFTVEAWIVPRNTSQDGPARIVSMSKNPNERNFTLGQDKNRYDVRFRSTRTSQNGLPGVTAAARSVQTRLTHVVYTRAKNGQAVLYLNGRPALRKSVPGETSNWDSRQHLLIGNEFSNDRPWLGDLQLVAIYHAALKAEEVAANFKAGPQAARDPEALARRRSAEQQREFLTTVAPVLANHCLECHDASTRKGGLDLSQRSQVLAGGENGPAVVPGKVEDSLLWQYIEADEMPLKRKPLTTEQKAILKNWIAGGAVWSGGVIDPAAYVHAGTAGQRWVQRLTLDEYIATVQATVGVDIRQEARELLPKDLRADGFSNTAYNLNVDLKHVQAYARLAEIIVDKMDAAAFARRFSRNRRLTDDSMRGLIAKMGPWLLRGPLADHEVDVYRGISTTVASAGGNFDDAVSLIVEAMLQSPRFIYRIENHRGDGGLWPVGPYEMASRLSYILWGAPPDAELYKAAAEGRLDRAGVRQQAARMLQDPRARRQSLRFVSEWLNLNRLSNLSPNAKKFPNWQPVLAADMREETLRYAEEILWEQQQPLGALLNSDITFLTPRLARHYGLAPQGDGWKKYDLKDVPSRGGLLTQGSVLTVGGDEASMVSRGLFVLHDLLRGVVKDPPPCVDTTPVPTKAGVTQRTIAEQRIANQACGGCHQKFEPLAFGLEIYDGLGTFHQRDEHGNKLRQDGEILIPGQARTIPYRSSDELMDLLAKSERVKQSLTWKLAQFALGRPLLATDLPLLEDIHKQATQAGGRYPDVITALVSSDLIMMSRTEAE